jgi:nuclear transcription factor Y, gamma
MESMHKTGLEDYDGPEITDEMYHSHLMEALGKFWHSQVSEMTELEIGTEQDFKNHNDLPLARIKRIMKSDEDVRMISAEAPVLFAKACEMFILELTLRSWCFSEKNKRKTLQKDDIDAAIKNTDIFDFLVGLQIAVPNPNQQP